MKKKNPLLSICLLAFILMVACNKRQDISQNIIQATGHLRYGGQVAADGIDYYIVTDSTAKSPSVYLSPENLPQYLQVPTIDLHVNITYYITGSKQFGLNPDFKMQTIHLIGIE